MEHSGVNGSVDCTGRMFFDSTHRGSKVHSMNLKSYLKAHLPPSYYRRLALTAKASLGWLNRNNLSHLALIYGTDKWGGHWYTQHYQRYFEPLKNKRLNILEIGVGGYDDLEGGGASLRMWKTYFRNSRIVGIDVYDKCGLSERRIDVRQCDQTDAETLLQLSSEYGGFDIIIDDGSHLNPHVIKSFQLLFPVMKMGGIYVVEDTQTAYWPTWGGGLSSPFSSMAFFKGLSDGLNHAEFPISDYEPNYFDRNIVEISFFHNMVFICKGNNDEGTNVPDHIKRELDSMRDNVRS